MLDPDGLDTGRYRLVPREDGAALTHRRHRQWIAELFAWRGQFGTCGRVGCARRGAWCPAGIAVTEQVATPRAAHETETQR
ncbi:hypothetical protein OG762_01020 [Streptomyces sp. NBC_01136]|uniref:hypothetical protein n=1 Tax=unclassified Streptomyces TaxID=2593676 RepID=UPI0032495300|nr:hypothetical protein OG762_01020 [Streptomyces sp. NBC_01136]